MNQEELNKILESHKDWLNGDGGKCANLRGADLRDADLRDADLSFVDLSVVDLRGANLRDANLRGADLRDADLSVVDLRGANLRGANLQDAKLRGANLRDANLDQCVGDRNFIKSIFISDVYPITYTKEVIQIGCERHEIKDWWGFDDKRILEMDGKKAIKFWREWKNTIKELIEKSPAK